MLEKEELYTAIVVIVFGLFVYILIPNQVSTDPIPGSMGFSQVGPATLPWLSVFGILLTGLIWLCYTIWKYRSARRIVQSGVEPAENAAMSYRPGIWVFAFITWLGMIVYVLIIPVLGYPETSTLFGLTIALTMARARPKWLQPSDWVGLLIGVVIFPFVLNFFFLKYLYVTLPPGPLSGLLIGR